MVNKVYSDNTELQYAYYDLPFVCPPTGQFAAAGGMLSGKHIPLNLGEVLRGDRIQASDIELAMVKDKPCTLLCTQNVSAADLKRARQLVRDDYVVEWIVDNLPGATNFISSDKSQKYYAAGFKLGYSEPSPRGRLQQYIYNHHTIVIRHRRAPGRAGDRGEHIVVGFEVYPSSVAPDAARQHDGCPADLNALGDGFPLHKYANVSEQLPSSARHNLVEMTEFEGTLQIPYTYAAYFREDNSIEWARRWDLYFVNQEEGVGIHWLAIINSVIICAMLTGMVFIIFAKTIYSDIKTYNDAMNESGKLRTKQKSLSGTSTPRDKLGLLGPSTEAEVDDFGNSDVIDEGLEDASGWKRLHGDVFRTPKFGFLLAPLVGSGVQFLFMAIGLVSLSALGLLNPSFRGGFISVGIGLFVFAGLFAGYFSSRVFRSFDGKDFRQNAMVTALLFPGLCFGLVFVLNLFVWAQASSTAIPFGTLLAIVFLWLCIQVPLVYAGAYYGFEKARAWEHPIKATTIPRQVPAQLWYMKPLQSVLLAGLIPFAVVFIELTFVFQSVWQDKTAFYYTFGFTLVVFALLIVTVAEVTVVTVYVHLCAENYNWWWQSFFIGGGSALWVFAYSMWYFIFKLHITGIVSSMLFVMYSFMACCVYGLLTGTVGFLTAYAFVRRIYRYVTVDNKKVR